MVDLIEQGPLDGRAAFSAGHCDVQVLPRVARWSVAPFAGKLADAKAALKTHAGVDWPAAGRVKARGGVRCSWWGHGQAMLEGAGDPSSALSGLAAVTDQGDAWTGLLITGDDAEAVLARLCEPDLRPATFKRGHVQRTEIRHMMVAVSRTSKGLEVHVMRSFADTLWEEITDAMEAVAARAAITAAR